MAPVRRRPGHKAAPLTPVIRHKKATVSATGRTYQATWAADSRDGLWRYDRGAAPGPRWTVQYLPTGQTARFSSFDGARAASAGPLLDQLHAAALTAAFHGEERIAGQRWLAVHLRLSGAADISATCSCGGLVARLPDGRHHHVDACAECCGTLPDPCRTGDPHRFCSSPDPQLTDVEVRILEVEGRWWRQPGAKVTAIRRELNLSEIGYFATLNRLIDKPAALRAAPAVVRRLREIRSRPRAVGRQPR